MSRPQVTLHFAQSLDGRIGLGPGAERAILSGDEGTACAHRARSAHDAILVGVQTLLHDDPLLTARGDARSQPLRVVLDSTLRVPLTARVLAPSTDGAGPVLVLACETKASVERRRALLDAGARVELLPCDEEGRVALAPALELLAARGVKSLLVEGGARVLTSFLRARLADRAEIEIAPLWLGGEATPALGALGVRGVTQASWLTRTTLERLGANFLLSGDVAYPDPGR
jgi:riboflavin-specific deaminase-like protein